MFSSKWWFHVVCLERVNLHLAMCLAAQSSLESNVLWRKATVLTADSQQGARNKTNRHKDKVFCHSLHCVALDSMSVDLSNVCSLNRASLLSVLCRNSFVSLSFVSLNFFCPGDSGIGQNQRHKETTRVGLEKGSCETTCWSRDLTQGRERSKDPTYPLNTFHAWTWKCETRPWTRSSVSNTSFHWVKINKYLLTNQCTVFMYWF